MVAMWGLLCALPMTAQQTTPQGSKARRQTTTVAARPTTVTDAEQEKFQELTHRIQILELEVAQKSKESSGDRAAIITALAVIGVAFVTLLGSLIGQFLLASRQDRRAIVAAEQAAELAKQEAIFRQTGTILEYRLKQMEQFYGPMRALLEQSRGLYEKMCDQLAQDEPQRYRQLSEPDAQGYVMQVFDDKDGTWKGFRLLDQLPAVRQSNPKAFALAEETLHIGEKMTEILSERAGLASEEVLDVLGQYMAHYATLSLIHKGDETEPYRPGSHPQKSYYPRELNPRIEAGYRELSQFIDKYTKAGERMLEAVPAGKGGQSHPS